MHVTEPSVLPEATCFWDVAYSAASALYESSSTQISPTPPTGTHYLQVAQIGETALPSADTLAHGNWPSPTATEPRELRLAPNKVGGL